MDRAAKQRPPLYIVNLQWTPKDSAATLKLNGRCDFVMAELMKYLKLGLPDYTPYNDPLLTYVTHLHEREEHTTTRRYVWQYGLQFSLLNLFTINVLKISTIIKRHDSRTLIESRPVGVNRISMEASVSDAGIIQEVGLLGKTFMIEKN